MEPNIEKRQALKFIAYAQRGIKRLPEGTYKTSGRVISMPRKADTHVAVCIGDTNALANSIEFWLIEEIIIVDPPKVKQ